MSEEQLAKAKAILYYKENHELRQEIERLTKQNKALNEMYELTKKEYIRLNNIIKEVREYIKSHREAVDERGEHIIYFLKDDFDEEDILEILKGSDKE